MNDQEFQNIWAPAPVVDFQVKIESLENEKTNLLTEIQMLRGVLDEIKDHCVCERDTYGFDYHETHKKLGKPKSGARWLTPIDIIELRLK